METNIKKVMNLDLYEILAVDEDATDSDVSNIVLERGSDKMRNTSTYEIRNISRKSFMLSEFDHLH